MSCKLSHQCFIIGNKPNTRYEGFTTHDSNTGTVEQKADA